MTPIELRASILHALPVVLGTNRIAPTELQAIESVLHNVIVPIPHALQWLYRDSTTAKSLKWGDVSAVAEALKWRQDAPSLSPDELWRRKQQSARALQEPVYVPVAHVEIEEIPEKVSTVEGTLAFEGNYLPRVIAGEHLHAHPEAKAALAIAARTYVLRVMRDHPTIGRTTPIKNDTSFQTFAAGADASCIAATERTRGFVMRYGGRLITANYVAGALWREDGSRGADATNTEKWVTYNQGRSGGDVIPTRLALSTHPGNRGCMSQNGAHWLGEHGWDCERILRFFYGDDIEIVRLGAREGGKTAGLAGIVAMGLVGLVVTGR
jgi:hypothetical protein